MLVRIIRVLIIFIALFIISGSRKIVFMHATLRTYCVRSVYVFCGKLRSLLDVFCFFILPRFGELNDKSTSHGN